jgi:ABC-type oligopeptide transport system substrate-binding subunit
MRKKHLLSLFMLSMGVALLVTAFGVSGASAARQSGGTLTIGTIGRVFSPDPATGYDTRSWTMQANTNLTLVGYADANGANAKLQFQGAKGAPIISTDGRTYTWTIRSGYKFSDNTYVTAKSYQRAFERILSPCSYAGGWGAVDKFDVDIVGGANFHNSHCSIDGQHTSVAHISGITATAPAGGGGTLKIKLTQKVPSLLPAMAMAWFSAVPVNTPYNAGNTQAGWGSGIPGAGPYYVSTWNKAATSGQFNIILSKNPHYNGPRPANTDTIRYLKYAVGDNEGCFTDVKANNIDLDMCGLTGTEVVSAKALYTPHTTTGVPGVAAGTGGRFHVDKTGCTGWVALNTLVAPTNNQNVRLALGYILNKDTYLSVLGQYAGVYNSSIMNPAIPGYKADNVFGHNPNWTKAYSLTNHGLLLKNKNIHVWYVSDTDPGVQQYNSLKANIDDFSNHYHLNIHVIGEQHSNTNYYDDIGTYAWTKNGGTSASGPTGPMNMGAVGWCPDYLDAYDFINVMFDGNTINKNAPGGNPDGEGANTNYSYANISALNTQMRAAAKLSGSARNTAYAAADKNIVGKFGLAIPYDNIGARTVTSNRVGNWHFNEYNTTPALNTLTVS